MIEKTNWPEPVAKLTNFAVKAFKEEGLFEAEPELEEEWFYEALAEIAFHKFVAGNGDMIWSDEEVDKAITKGLAYSITMQLKKEGLMDWIEDENGEQIVFLTEKGKKVGEKYKK
jgi:hypothetical protein